MPHLRYAVLADIHGNLPALEAVLEHMDGQRLDGVLVAGDVVGGPDGAGVLQLLQPHTSGLIAGNNEEYLLSFHRGSALPQQRESRQWAFARACCRRAGAAAATTLSALPPQLSVNADGATPVRMVHGSTSSSKEALRPDLNPDRLRQVMAQIHESVLICGHTHVPWTFRHAGRLAFNPGSAGGSCNGDNRAQYAMLSWNGLEWQVEHRAVSYDLDRVQRVYRDSGFLEEAGPMARAQLEGIVRADRTMGNLVRHARAVARRAGLGDLRFVPDEAWDRAVGSFQWQLPPP